ncbi:MAG: rhomboid family intramembrane serine protease [Methanomassiliicoccales archaeon]
MDTISILALAVIIVSILTAVSKRISLTLALIVANFLVFFLQVFTFGFAIELDLGFRPQYLQSGERLYTVLTSIFVHASAMHLLGNMIFLLFIGWPLEERLGKSRPLLIFLVAGAMGAMFEGMVRLGEPTLILGASGAIAGLVGALFILYPKERLTLPLFIIILPNIPVWVAAMAFFLVQLIIALGIWGGGIAVVAHLAGFVAGMALGWNLPKRTKVVRSGGYDLNSLKPLATTPELQEMLQHIENESQEDVRRAWLEHFASKAKCPICGSSFTLKRDSLKSECGYEVRLR